MNARSQMPFIPDSDLEAFVTGSSVHAYRFLGAHLMEVGGSRGTRFAVWAPNAGSVSVVGGWNGWDGRAHAMARRGATGVWELFVPGVKQGALYKYEIQGYQGQKGEKADPYGFAMELRPNTASRVWPLVGFDWADAAWIAGRPDRQRQDRPLSVYEVHLSSWKRGAGDPGWLDYDGLSDELLPYVRDLGFTHLELLPVTEHPYDKSWGYQPIGYFAPTSRFGDPDGFRRFVDRAHRLGLGVLLDWVPAHFPKDGHGLVYFDGTHLYEHADPRKGHHPDWGTFIYNLTRPQVRSFLLSSAMFWIEEMHVDGLRVDAVASMLYLDYSRKEGEWVPNQYGGRENLEAVEFLKRMNYEVHSRHPGTITFAEESTAWPRVSGAIQEGGLGFDYKWNMGWMNDTLEYMRADPLFRSGAHDRLTFSMHYAYSERFLLPLSHDEVVHGKGSLLAKMPGDVEHRFANLRLLYGAMAAHPGRKLLFMGSELAPWREWDAEGGLEWGLLGEPRHAAIHRYVARLNALYRSEPALHELDDDPRGFAWIDCKDRRQSVVVFVRRAKDPGDFVVAAANYTPVLREGYRIGVPEPGIYRVLLNSDDAAFAGTGTSPGERLQSSPEPWHGQKHSLLLTLPPLAIVWLKLAARDES